MDSFSYNTSNWKYHSNFILGACPMPDRKIRLITYSPCDCQEKYKFKKNSPLLPYLQQCEGWVNDSQGYTLNYIMIIFIALLKERELIFFSNYTQKHFVLPAIVHELRLKTNESSSYNLSGIRIAIAKRHLRRYRKFSYTEVPYFICAKGIEEIVLSILGPEGSEEQYFGNHSSHHLAN